MSGPWLRRFLSATAAALIVGFVGAAGAGPALAEPPYRLDSQISDPAGALSPADEADLAAAQDQLNAAQGIQLWVSYVDTFEGMSGEEWTTETAQLSGFGGNDMLFAVAIEDRAYGYSVAQDMPVTDAQLEDMMGSVEQLLSDGDWGGAATELANMLADPSGSTGGSSGGPTASVLPWLLGGA
ncbi:MAG: TPM domain-containing protein, partial [Candidatus Nanopelagicales bacterium]